jgi:hypothetical protein
MWKVPVEVDTEGEGDAPAVSESGLPTKAHERRKRWNF